MFSNQSSLYSEEDLVPISALQHLIFCERQWALIHLEQIWEDNRLTAEGNQLHERVDTPGSESRKNIKIVRSLRLRSLKYGLTGIADVVEFQRMNEADAWQPYPIEYKRGKPKKDLSDSVQLCAQAICLEEMLKLKVPKGAFYYGELKTRVEIELDDSLRKSTLEYIQRLHQIIKAKKTPQATYEKKCNSCSLINHCMPNCTNGKKSVAAYMNSIIKGVEQDSN